MMVYYCGGLSLNRNNKMVLWEKYSWWYSWRKDRDIPVDGIIEWIEYIVLGFDCFSKAQIKTVFITRRYP